MPRNIPRGLIDLLGVLAVALLLNAPADARNAPGDPLTLPGLKGQPIEDPVFDGTLQTYQGGPEDAPTLVLVHGIDKRGGAAWKEISEGLSQDYRLIAFDLPGFGASTRGNHLYGPDQYVRVLDHVISELADPPVFLLGHSLGGAIALRYAARHPDNVEHLLISSAAGILHKAAYTSFLARTPWSENDGWGTDRWLDRTGGQVIRQLMRQIPDAGEILLSAPGRRVALRSDPTRIAALALVETDFSRTLHEHAVPTSVFWGARDRITPVRTGQLLAGLPSGGDLEVFPEAGHAPMLDAPEAFLKAVQQRLKQDRRSTPREPPDNTPGEATFSCQDEHGKRIAGRYDTIRIDNCQRVTLEDIAAREVHIRGSQVALTKPQLIGGSTALRAEDSEVMLTAGSLTGDVAIEASGSELDIAGTRLKGDTAALRGGEGPDSEVIFSVTPIHGAGGWHYRHEMRSLAPGETL